MSAFADAAAAVGQQGSSAPTGTDQLTGNNRGYDPLFGGEKLPSLFNKTHDVGTELSGVIAKAPEDRQSRFYKAGGLGALKFWAPSGSEKPVTDKEINPDGTKNRPCMDTMFVLDTDYRMTADEMRQKGMDEDNGQRGVFAGGADLIAIRKAIREVGVTSREQLVGMRLTLKRTGKTVKGDFEAWNWEAKLSR